ncbi:hypothetical protein PAPYR_2781 [Paratrimastix pyriformis]|uniref:Uncharacterized protein n=1 Tax=Paratrimastix pyriformis TaxID=342808 RepID=A0ABQ8UVZ8_9EUKA|nr:hypothetical protein PAPYR_2781 [Paratrimastix pyriformis]
MSRDPLQDSSNPATATTTAAPHALKRLSMVYIDPPADVELWKCLVCGNHFVEPVILSCGHHVCRVCVPANASAGQSGLCPVPGCGKRFEHFIPNPVLAKAVIPNLRILCVHHAPQAADPAGSDHRDTPAGIADERPVYCEAVVTVATLQQHLDTECPAHPVACPNQCGWTGARTQIPGHLQDHCLRRLVLCPQCKELVLVTGLEERHSKQECTRRPQDCRQGCGQKIPLADMDEHCRRDCKNRPQACPYHVMGCEELVAPPDLGRHCAERLTNHADMLLLAVTRGQVALQEQVTRGQVALQEQVKRLTDANAALTEAKDVLQRQVASQGEQIAVLTRHVEVLAQFARSSGGARGGVDVMAQLDALTKKCRYCGQSFTPGRDDKGRCPKPHHPHSATNPDRAFACFLIRRGSPAVPIKFALKLPKMGAMEAARGQLARLSGIPPEQLILCECLAGKIYDKIADSCVVADQRETVLYGYEVADGDARLLPHRGACPPLLGACARVHLFSPPGENNMMHMFTAHRKDERVTYSSYSTYSYVQKKNFGVPLVISFAAKQTTCRQVHQQVWDSIRRMIAPETWTAWSRKSYSSATAAPGEEGLLEVPIEVPAKLPYDLRVTPSVETPKYVPVTDESAACLMAYKGLELVWEHPEVYSEDAANDMIEHESCALLRLVEKWPCCQRPRHSPDDNGGCCSDHVAQ